MMSQRRLSLSPAVLYAGMVVVLLIAFGLRVGALNDKAISADELRQYSLNVRKPVWGISWDDRRVSSHMAAVLMDKLSVQVLGDNLYALRWPGACLSLLNVVLIFKLGAWFRRRWTGLLAGLLLAIVPVAIFYDYDLRSYNALMFFVLVASYLSLRATRQGAGRTWYAAAAAWGLAVFSHLAAVLAWPGIVWIVLLTCARPLRPVRRWLPGLRRPIVTTLIGVGVGLLAALGPALVHFVFEALQGTPADAGSLYNPQEPNEAATLLSSLSWFSGRNVDDIHGQPAMFYLVMALAVLAVLLALIRRRGTSLISWLGGLLLPFAGYAFITWLMPDVMGRERYFGFAMPFLLLIVAAAPEELWHSLGRLWHIRPAGYYLLSAGVVAAIAAFWVPTLGEFYRKETLGNWRNVTAGLMERLGPRDLILCEPFDHAWGEAYDNANKPCRRNMEYWLRSAGRLTIYPILSLGGASNYDFLAKNTSEAERTDRVWLVLFNVPAGADLSTAGDPAWPEWNQFGRTVLLPPFEGVTIVQSLVLHQQRVNGWTHTPETQLVNHGRLAQLASMLGDTATADAEWAAAEALRSSVPDSEAYLEPARQVLERPALW